MALVCRMGELYGVEAVSVFACLWRFQVPVDRVT